MIKMETDNSTTRQPNFIIQGFILAIAGILVRIIGLAYRIPLIRIIGDEGMGYYSTAYNLYAVMLLLSSYSLPLAVSKMVSARIVNKDYKNAGRIFRVSLFYATIVGALGCGIIYFGADFFANTLFRLPLSKYALLTLAPTVWIMAYLGVFRGYYQGFSTMVPTAVSQIFEQIINAIISVFAAWYLCETALKASMSASMVKAYGASGGTIGTGAGALSALLILIILFLSEFKKRKFLTKQDSNEKKESYGEITKILIFTVIPVIASTAIYNINSIIDSSIFGISMNMLGRAADTAKEYGIYTGKYLILINVPVAISNALSSSLIPTLSRAVSKNDKGGIEQGISLAIRFAVLISIPAAIGLAILAEPIITLLFGRSMMAIRMMQFGSVAIVFYSISTISNAILQGTNNMSIPVKNAVLSLIVHIIALIIMLNIFKMGIYAMVYANIIFALCMCIFNALAIRNLLNYKQEVLKTYIGPIFSAGIMGFFAYIMYKYLIKFNLNNIILCVLPFLISIIIYPVALIKTHSISEAELRLMPKGRKLVAIAKKFRLI